MNLQITAVIDPAEPRLRMKTRRGGGWAQFFSFNFANTPIWEIRSRAREGENRSRTRRRVVQTAAQSNILPQMRESTPTRFLPGQAGSAHA
jgi:hypothetical protein